MKMFQFFTKMPFLHQRVKSSLTFFHFRIFDGVVAMSALQLLSCPIPLKREYVRTCHGVQLKASFSLVLK